ncbi:type II secretion system F family protein [Arthrobacter burdickii]|uniref:Type II secretion system F family protein n=1 Tax=Arthrobacter burdickii TaxID=3035920 RepID=A0ABT8K0Y4_9MICC|nr:type II secretion system F family protein [Arthrobacter burdickii]MDN4610762.1 type II secretion system F family protein [Arthrobacter burdickii]
MAYLGWALSTSDRKSVLAIHANLNRGISERGDKSSGASSALTAITHKVTPDVYVSKIDGWLALAGRPASMPLEKVIVAKPALALIGASLGFLLFSKNPGLGYVALGLFIIALFYFVPDLLIYNTGIKRQEAIQTELPDTLDQMLISVEAGLGFEAAMARAAANGKGPMAQELTRTLQDLQVGRPRRDAYQALAQRSSVDELKSFVGAIVQADKYGIGIANVLRAQAKQSRVRRRQRAEEKAMQLPVKVLFPLLLFIFPVMFIVILGPAVINMMNTFGGM